jgi:hypothetical protein
MLLMAWRAQSGGDQLNLLSRGWLWAERGVFLPYGNPLSSGGYDPGPLTTLLVGAPLLLWRDHRAPIVLVLVFHLLAYLLLDRVIARRLPPRERLLFALLYWLNPWRLNFSGFLWNPNYLFLPAAVHLTTAWASRERARFGASFAHVLAVGVASQLHPSFVILAIASAWLVWRRAVRTHWPGVLAGAAAVVLSYWPWLRVVFDGQRDILPGSEGFLLRGLIYVFPLLRGWLYWLRYASLYLPGDGLRLDFVDTIGADWNSLIAQPLSLTLAALLPLTVALPLYANARLLRRLRARLRRRAPAASLRGWLRQYALAVLLAATLSFALAPTTVMAWQALIALHAAVLPLLFLGAAALRLPWRRALARRLAIAWAIASVLITTTLAFGSRRYRCHGSELMGFGVVVRHDHPMFHDLGIEKTCPIPFDAESGWWPDGLPEE